MLDWFSKNSAAVQALSAGANVLVALVLAGLTGWYVRLTRDIARSSLAQVEYFKDAATLVRRQSAAALEALSRRIRVPLAELNNVSPAHDRLRNYSFLTHQDVTDLESLARSINTDAVSLAARAAVSLRVILNFIDKTRGVKPQMGWMPTAKESSDWISALDAAPKLLAELEDSCRQA